MTSNYDSFLQRIETNKQGWSNEIIYKNIKAARQLDIDARNISDLNPVTYIINQKVNKS